MQVTFTKFWLRIPLFALLLVLGVNFCLAARGDDFEFFEKKIRPLLVERCYRCHSLDAEKLKGGLLLDSKAGMLKGGDSGKPVLVPGNAEASRLVEAIRYQNEDLQMPPPKLGKLKDDQIADLVAWVNMGAPDPRTNVAGTSEPVADKYKKARTHWAFQPVKNPPVPVVDRLAAGAQRHRAETDKPQTPIDNFILAKLAEKGLQLSPPADKRTLIRRASYDLTGLPPTADEVEAFLKDKSPEAIARVVDRLLASPRYGERWGRYWLDVARFADTKGYVYGGREEARFIHSAAYRDWVIAAFNADMPYDRFLKLQIAADQVEGAELNSLAAMGYLTLGRRFLGVVHDIIDDRIDVVMRGTQGLTVGCARCHDHKFDPIPTRDYYSLYGVFAGCNEREVALDAGTKTAKAYLDFETELKKREEKFHATFNARREEQSKRLRAKTPEYLVAVLNVEKLPSEEFYSFVQADDINPVIVRSWHSYLLANTRAPHPIWSLWQAYGALPANEFEAKAGSVFSSLTNAAQMLTPLVAKAFAEKVPASMREVAEIYGKLLLDVDKKSSATDKKVTLSKDEEELHQVLHAADSPASVPAGAIVDMEWYFEESTRVELGQLSAQIDQWILQSPGAPPHAVILEDRPVQKTQRVFKRGNPANKGDEVPRQFVEILAGNHRQPFVKGSGRLELAEAIASKENPLTARVFVNRLWLHHFGAGLVRTPSDFGTRAEPPSHPELLDWLSRYFMDQNWSVKKVQRLIMLSAVYQQSSDLEPTGRTTVATSRSVQPAALSLGKTSVHASQEPASVIPNAATLDPENRLLWHMNRQRLDFESLRDSLLFVAGQLDPKPGGKAEELFKAPFSKRRSVYGFIDRQFLPGALRVFDFASPDMHNPQRSETTVPQQALFFMNGPFVVEQARALAGRVAPGKESKTAATDERIRKLYQLVYQREPTPAQLKRSRQFLETAASSSLEEEAKKKVPSAWKYGYGEFDEAAKKLKAFAVLPYFTDDAWQGGKDWPDAQLGWARLTATGGHAGNDLQHAVIRRWVAPLDGVVDIEGSLKHEHPEGDGIKAWILSSRAGLLGTWALHNQTAPATVKNLEVKQGDSVDFVVAINPTLNNNDFLWSPVIRMTGPNAVRDANGYAREWSASKEFGGIPSEDQKPLTPWEKYAQVLLLSNEFVFVD